MADRDNSDDEQEKTIEDEVVVTKYKMSGDMANGMLPFLWLAGQRNVEKHEQASFMPA